jgi:maltose alpha-D-glucosyltransferase / alpha-amylase
MRRRNDISEQPLWYKDAIFYEVRVRSFYDASGDGVGDFAGLTQKLDYLHDLGVTALWLLPFYPSPQRDDGYDISDYMDVHPDCGSIQEFKAFLREAHRRDLRVITELVINHTSEQHPWFQRARRAAKGDPARDFFVWSDSAESYADARIIFQDFEPSNWTWDPRAKAYYWHRFYSHQPDLNFDNPEVRKEVVRILDFWLEMGVDGLRLDAVPYLYEREGTTCENLPETHSFLRELRAHVDREFRDRMLLAEANQWPEDAVAYFGGGHECHMAFHFPLMPRIFMAVRMEDRFPITDIWAQTPSIDESCQWALFLRNHDELTLEMVTDEERDYMYRAYAQESRMRLNLGIRRRLSPLLGNNRRAIELVHGLLFALPGTPVLYYGDEIGMGDNVYLGDRDGVRTPMQWSGDRNAGFSTADSQRLILPIIIDHEYHYQTVNVEAQERNRHSLLWWIRRLIAMRKQFKAFGRGTIEFLSPENPRVLAFIRSHGNEQILVVANLSRFVQYVELDLSRFKGSAPIELFGRTQFPRIGELPYLLTLGPHMFDWFSIEGGENVASLDIRPHDVPRLEVTETWDQLIRSEERQRLEKILPDYLPHCRWFRSKARQLKTTRIVEVLPVSDGDLTSYLSLVDVEYGDAEPETYVLPLAAIASHDAHHHAIATHAALAHLRMSRRNGNSGKHNSHVEQVVFDATGDKQFEIAMLGVIEHHRHLRGIRGEAIGVTSSAYHTIRPPGGAAGDPHLLKAEQTNSSIAYGHDLIFKLFRRIEPGISPDLEISRFLTERTGFAHTPRLAGWIEYRVGRGEPLTMGVMHGFVPNHGDAWEYTRRELNRYFERAATRTQVVSAPGKPLIDLLADSPDRASADMVGAYLDMARLLGHRTAELHLALSSEEEDLAFNPEPFSSQLRSTYQSMRNLAGRTSRLLRDRLTTLPEDTRKQALRLTAHEEQISACFDAMLKRRTSIVRIRTHGDLHLGQVLYTGKDFVIIDFEGEPARPLTERRRKRPGLRDVAGMLRSFHYAAFGTLLEETRSGKLGGRDFASMEPWATLWQEWTSWAFLKAYLETAGESPIVPKDREELKALLEAFVLDKAFYELGYELNNRPDWVGIPLHGIQQILRTVSE